MVVVCTIRHGSKAQKSKILRRDKNMITDNMYNQVTSKLKFSL